MPIPQKNKLQENVIFSDFGEYWHYMKNLNKNQRDIIFDSLSPNEKRMIERSYRSGGWEDLFMRNSLDILLDRIRRKFKYDMLEIRGKVLKGKSVYIPKIVWDYLMKETKAYDFDHVRYIIDGIHPIICKSNKKVVLLVASESGE